jgi:hypothetical protein
VRVCEREWVGGGAGGQGMGKAWAKQGATAVASPAQHTLSGGKRLTAHPNGMGDGCNSVRGLRPDPCVEVGDDRVCQVLPSANTGKEQWGGNHPPLGQSRCTAAHNAPQWEAGEAGEAGVPPVS